MLVGGDVLERRLEMGGKTLSTQFGGWRESKVATIGNWKGGLMPHLVGGLKDRMLVQLILTSLCQARNDSLICHQQWVSGEIKRKYQNMLGWAEPHDLGLILGWDIPHVEFWGNFPLDVVFIINISKLWLGYPSLCFKVGYDQTCGYWVISVLVFWGHFPLFQANIWFL